MSAILKLWWLAFPIAYIVVGVIVGIAVAANGGDTPVISGILWPVPVIRMLFGKGPLSMIGGW